ncbi:hypothetical protein [Xanthomarina gelatinilytica]|uniref:hypothetical protein n=1 Tax=Xanthomarina gelatinilytica TaxID=1137281 RepID=UPI003AA90430
MAVAAFIELNDSEFTLNGIPYDKTFIALPCGNNAIAVVGVYEGRNRILDNTPIADITVGGVTYGTVALLIAALKPVLYNYGEGTGGGGTGTTYLGKKPYTLNLFGIATDQDELDYVAAAIQRGNGTNPLTAPAFECAVGQEMIFRTSTISGVVLGVGGLPESYTITTRDYSLYDATLTSVGGVGSGTEISRASIYNDGERKIYVGVEDIEDLVTHFGEIGSTPIEDKVNEGRNGGDDPYIIEGFRVFDCLRSGELFIYVFIGIPGEYGGVDMGTGGILEAFAEDFQDITDQPIVSSTNNYITYANIAAMLAGVSAQTIQNTLYVKDASADTNIIFPAGETKKHAFYKLKGESETGTISDYVLVSAPFAINAKASVTADTGTTINLNNPLGNSCNMLSANGNSAFTTTASVAGGEATVLINRATEPTVSGATKIAGHTFQASTNMHLKVKCRQSGIVQYYFLKLT